MDGKKPESNNKGISRRDLLKFTAGTAVFTLFFGNLTKAYGITTGENPPDVLTGNIQYRMSVCQNCHARCGLLGKVVDGVLVKLDGNPYHPNNMEEDERLAFATTANGETNRGRLCPKGQSGVQVLYNPYRIKHPLKKVGARGSGKWEVISWATAFSEIATAINAQIPKATRLVTNVDSSVSQLGKIANQLMFSPGRSTDGEIIDRVFKNTWGTKNSRLDHTSICEVSHHVGNSLMTWNETTNAKGNNHYKPDIESSEFIIFFGANPLEAGFPMLALARKIVDGIKNNSLKLAIVDPRLSNSAAKALQTGGWWVPAKPGTDGALALGMARYIIDNTLYDATYLQNANSAAATADSEKTWTDATWLVIKNGGASDGKYLRVKDVLPLSDAANTNKVVWDGATLREAGTAGADAAVDQGVLGTNNITMTNGVTQIIKKDGVTTVNAEATITNLYSAFKLVRNRVEERTVAQYASICGVDATIITDLATEFTSHGKKAVANTYRGTVQHTNGIYGQFAVNLLNQLIGNFDWRGGAVFGGGSYSYNAGMTTSGEVGVAASGVRIDRTQLSFNTGGNYDYYKYLNATYPATYAYPATRPWFQFGLEGNYQEIIPSINDQYPYACKVLITYWNAMPYSIPGAKDLFVSTVSDTNKVPLFVAISTTMGETEMYADYILPDTTYLEKWSFPGMTPTILTKATSFRQPLVGTFDGNAWDAWYDPTLADGSNAYTPIYPDTKMFEDILIGLFGTAPISLNSGVTNAWGHIKTGLTNLAASSAQTVANIIAKGGAFQDTGNAYANFNGTVNASGLYPKGVYNSYVKMYNEPLAMTVDSMGAGVAKFEPIAQYQTIKDIQDNDVSNTGYSFQLITYKSVLHGQARTIDLPWVAGISPENFIWINSQDASSRSIRTYDEVKVTSASNLAGIVGRAKVTEGVRPGVVAVSHHFGHWQHSSSVWYEDSGSGDVAQSYDSSRNAGIQPNLVMRLDPQLGDVSLQDKVGTSCSFYDTWVNIEKVS